MNDIIGCDCLPLRDLGNRHFIDAFAELFQPSLITGMFNELVCGSYGCLQLCCINDASKTFHEPPYILLFCPFCFKILSDGVKSFNYNIQSTELIIYSKPSLIR